MLNKYIETIESEFFLTKTYRLKELKIIGRGKTRRWQRVPESSGSRKEAIRIKGFMANRKLTKETMHVGRETGDTLKGFDRGY